MRDLIIAVVIASAFMLVGCNGGISSNLDNKDKAAAADICYKTNLASGLNLIKYKPAGQANIYQFHTSDDTGAPLQFTIDNQETLTLHTRDKGFYSVEESELKKLVLADELSLRVGSSDGEGTKVTKQAQIIFEQVLNK